MAEYRLVFVAELVVVAPSAVDTAFVALAAELDTLVAARIVEVAAEVWVAGIAAAVETEEH